MVSNLPKNFSGSNPSSSAASAELPKNFKPDMIKGLDAIQAAPRKPEVTRSEIAEFFARRMIGLRDQAKGTTARPKLYAIEFPYSDFEYDVAHAYARLLGAALHQGSDGPTPAEPVQPLVMLGRAVAGPLDIERFFHYINHGNDVHVLCTRAWQLPQPVLDLVDATLSMPRFDQNSFGAACMDFYELDAPPTLEDDIAWVGNVVPRDFLLNSQVERDEIVPAVRRSVERRLERYDTSGAYALGDLCGMDEAHEWANSLVEEIRLAQTGGMSWGDIESRVILIGGRGVGKTTLTRSIAHAAGLRFVETSAGYWASTDSEPGLGWARLNADFQEALAAAPTVFFIDDIDVFTSQPWAQLLPHFLEQLKGMAPYDRLVVIAGAQTAENVRFELRQRGGLESMLAMPAPNSQALAKMYAVMLKDTPHTLAPGDLDHVGRLSLGLGGHEVDLIVRRAIRRARKDGSRQVDKGDIAQILIQERFGSHAESRRRLMAEDELLNTAYHEAGHAILQLMRTRGAGLGYATIIPRENGTLGFVLPSVDETRNSMTRQDILETIRVALAGRAAEEILGGKDSVTTGCGNDLYQATRHLQYLLTRTGFNGLLSLDCTLEDSPDLRAHAEEILQNEYTHVLELLKRHRALLDQVAQLLVERQEVSGDELMTLYHTYQANNPGL
ncbi:MAG: AAA family ATPase [Alphaproteobacteria bacterium]|nr:AAA family ATPase [Alphaproteobacteria bacterium]